MVQLERGAVIGDKLRLLRPLGQGGMGSVWVAKHLGLDMEVAVKLIRPECVAYDPTLLPRFEREARAAARISSPHVVHIKDYGVVDDHPYLVMELLRGDPLSEVIQREAPLSLERATPLVVEVAEALESAHQQGIVHRDIKPHNIVLTASEPGGQEHAKVCDFGVAKVVGEGPVAAPGSAITQTGTVVGSPPYMSPEQLEGREDVDRRADIWSLGIVAYQMLTGTLPFAGSSVVTVGAAVLRGEYVAASELQPSLPSQIDDWFAKVLCLEPAGRFETARDLAEAFVAVVARHRAAQREGASAPAAPRARPSESDVAALGDATTQLQDLDRDSRPGRDEPAEGDEALPGGTVPRAPRAQPKDGPGAPPAPPVAEEVATGSGTASRARRPQPIRRGAALAAIAVVATAVAVLWMRTGPNPGPPPETSASPVVVTPEACPAGMRFIGGGTFAMGSVPADETRTDETPQRTQKVASFCLDTTEVTVAAYNACEACTAAPTTVYLLEGITLQAQSFWGKFCNGSHEKRQDHPINCVDWEQARTYCAAQGRRLPTEQEWEYAARGTDGRDYPWGNEPPSEQRLNGCGPECAALLNQSGKGTYSSMYAHDDGFAATAPVGQFPDGASPASLLDLAGNVLEWTADPYCRYDLPKCSESRRVLRGGAWITREARDVRVTRRFPAAPEVRSHMIGFRCAWPPRD